MFNHHDKWFAQASFTIALGLFSMATGYRLAGKTDPTWINNLSIDDGRLRIVARVVTLVAACLMFYKFAGFSVIDIALQDASQIGSLRYLGTESDTDAYVVVRLIDALTCSLPLVWLIRNRRLDYLIYGVGFIALILPLRRAAILTVVLLSVTIQVQRVNYRKLAIVILILLSVYVASQIFFLNSDEGETARSVASALPEVRDLGWIMKLMDGNYLHGATLVQPFDPLPSLVDTWKNTHSFSYVMTVLAGGGLRITLSGEGFINFWYVGPVILGFPLGWGAAWASRSICHASTVAIRYLAATAFIWVCLWFYMGASSSLGTVKFEFIIFALMYFIARKRPSAIAHRTMQPVTVP